jgi:chemotaxis family two-component system sensor kinase Cph1
MQTYFQWLCDTSDFITRDSCGIGWTNTLILVNRVANFLIFLSYLSIPISLFYCWLQLRRSHAAWLEVSPVNKTIIINFMCFIVFCGLTHLCDVLVFEWAAYRLFTLMDVLTALASVPTAIILPSVVRTVVVGDLDE